MFLHKKTYNSKGDRILLFWLSTWPLSHGHAKTDTRIVSPKCRKLPSRVHDPDSIVKIKDLGKLESAVYCNSTHTDKYLSFDLTTLYAIINSFLELRF